MKKLTMIMMLMLIAGCDSVPIRQTMGEVERAAIVANDLQLEVSTKGVCSSAASSILRMYGGRPEQLRHLFGLCGWSEYLINIMSGSSP